MRGLALALLLGLAVAACAEAAESSLPADRSVDRRIEAPVSGEDAADPTGHSPSPTAPGLNDERSLDGARDKIAICHRTRSEDNPFVYIEVSESAVSGASRLWRKPPRVSFTAVVERMRM